MTIGNHTLHIAFIFYNCQRTTRNMMLTHSLVQVHMVLSMRSFSTFLVLVKCSMQSSFATQILFMCCPHICCCHTTIYNIMAMLIVQCCTHYESCTINAQGLLLHYCQYPSSCYTIQVSKASFMTRGTLGVHSFIYSTCHNLPTCLLSCLAHVCLPCMPHVALGLLSFPIIH